jgi:hypothetical protein
MESSTDEQRSLSPSTRSAKRVRFEGDDDANKTVDDPSDKAIKAFCQAVQKHGLFSGHYSDTNAQLHLATAVGVAINAKIDFLNPIFRDVEHARTILKEDEKLANLVRQLFNNPGHSRKILYHRSFARLSNMNIRKLILNAQLLFSCPGQVRNLQHRNNID